MNSDNEIREQGYQYFLAEAPELLQNIEQELLNLREDYSLVKVHSLMRSTHTLKGAAANVGLETIKTISHHLEDVFKALYNPEVEIDPDLEMLLYEGYECLRLPLMAEITGSYVNESEALDRAVSVFAKLQEKLGDYFGKEAQIPSSVELGFDITKSIFEVGVKQRLETLATALESANSEELEAVLREQIQVFIGLGESLNLPGFGAIAQTTLTALELHPEQLETIANVALLNFSEGWSAVMEGDRTSGGQPSPALQKLAYTNLETLATDDLLTDELIEISPHNLEIIPDVELIVDELPETETEATLKSDIEIGEGFVEPSLDDVFGNLTEMEDQQIFADEIEETEISLSEVTVEVTSGENLTVAKIEKATPEHITETHEFFVNGKREVSQAIPEQFVEQTPTKVKFQTSVSTSQTAANSKAPHSSVRVDLELLERLSHLAGEMLIGQNRQSNISEQLQESIEQLWYRLRRHQQTINELRDWSDQMLITQERHRVIDNLGANFDSLELDQHSELHELLQVTLEDLVQLEEAIESTDYLAKQSSQILAKQRRLLNNTQEDLRTARMLPLGEIFSRFPRLLQQLSSAHNKRVKLTLIGTEVLVDRALAEKLYDPLLHLVRNAFDHGIEPPEIRANQGKPETGNIAICAYHRANKTIIEVRDDGQGLDLDRIRRRAVEMQILSVEQADKASEAILLNLLFEPGFSTASQVSDLSGRGIGLNVVRSQMEMLSGSVIVNSEPRQGTTFLLQFPLSLTMAKLMICEAKGTVYALLSDAIDQIILPKTDQIQYSNGQKVLHLNKQKNAVIPIYNMAELMRGNSAIYHSKSPTIVDRNNLEAETFNFSTTPLLLLRQTSQVDLWQGTEIVALEIDQIMGEQELVIRSLGKAIAPPSYIYGGSTLADGRLTLVIDPIILVSKLLDQVTGKTSNSDWQWETNNSKSDLELLNLQLNPPATLPQLSATPKKILVVDDSISVRQTLAMTLQRSGYQVLQAQNGRDALHQIQQNRGIQLVICDIEMPSMNGFEFLNNYRQDATLTQVPVIMLTSRTGEKHRLLAKELGAAGYFTKPYREAEMLQAIADLFAQKVPSLA
ncbi:hybrid sensor histidine kinase/response regulator [Phormidium sp. LEGE 05292]|uniref:hybrid sensor histidine kinase/response regulator n=1 Tax=[Phormidium] sp. LEGE 05292 TaxID=767427 RepID=UPI001880EA6A|nr:hybrid sensor histidine kinase/response regulator [Phormidium sp. LEGE 05292]MBE9224628.1 hybrid sensor histidine kinase/response regulator [Phormidium sp. LEGE 05292]